MTEPTDAELDTVLTEVVGSDDMHDHWLREIGRPVARAVLAKWGQPAQAAEPVATQWLAEMIMSDCGCSTENQRLLDRIIDRIQQYDRANTATQPVAREPLSDEQYNNLVEDLSEWSRHVEVDTAPQSLEKHIHQVFASHGIKGGQHVS